MKKSRQCPKCSSLRIGYLAEQPDVESAMEHEGESVAYKHSIENRAVGHSVGTVNTGFLSHGKVRVLIGSLEAYVCTDCGYHESYVKAPNSVEWESIAGFAWIHPQSDSDDGPYR